MNTIPTEILEFILTNLTSPSDLCALRAVNRSFRDICTPSAFRTLTIRHTHKSITALGAILSTPLPCHVHEIQLLLDVPPPYPDPVPKYCSILPELKLHLARLPSFSSLTSLAVVLPHLDLSVDGSAHSSIHYGTLLLVWSYRPPALRTFAITNASCGPMRGALKDSRYKQFFAGISSLSISDEAAYNNWSPTVSKLNLWYGRVQEQILPAARESLRELNLECNGHPWPCPRGIHRCMGLARLSLKGFILCAGEEWVKSCALEELVLDGCLVHWEPRDGRKTTTWYRLFREMKRDMGGLVRVDVFDSGGGGSGLGYVEPRQTFGYTVFNGRVSHQERDLPFLEGLLETVEKRRRLVIGRSRR